MTAERNVYAGDTTQTPNPAKPRPAARLDLDAIRDRAAAATTGPWGVETEEFGLMVLNRGLGMLVATAGAPDDTQAAADAEFVAAAREDVPALLDEIVALDQVSEDAVALTEQIGAELRAARTEVDRLQRLLDTRDVDYALVVRVDTEGLSQIDGSPGLTLEQAAEWLQELATDTARRAAGADRSDDTAYRMYSRHDIDVIERAAVVSGADTMRSRIADMFEHGHSAGIARDIRSVPLVTSEAQEQPPLCSAPCPHGHDHTCARSPQHLGPHRDVKQKGTENCSWPGQ